MTTATPGLPASASVPPRDGRKRLVVVVLLLAVSALMVWGTWAAIDDLRPKAMTAELAVTGGALRIVNTSGFAWTNAVFTVDDRYTAAWPARVENGAALVLPLAQFVDAGGQALAAGETLHEVTAEATRHSWLGRVNGARPTSGRWLVP